MNEGLGGYQLAIENVPVPFLSPLFLPLTSQVIEEHLHYPGAIEITVVREIRAAEFAK